MTLLQKPTERDLLPFANSSQNDDLVFDSEIEKATIFCLTELAREKGGGFFKKQDSEKIVYISKIYYPFWLTPFMETTLILDGLGIAATTIAYQILPVIKDFKEKLNERSISPEVYANFLANHQNYFLDSKEQKKFTIEGLLDDPDFKTEFWTYAMEAKTTDSPITDAVLITPAINEEGATRITHDTEITRQSLTEELTQLTETIKLLNAKTQQAQATLREKSKAVVEKFNIELQNTKTIVDSKIAIINKKYLEMVAEATKKFNELTKNLEKEIMKSRKELEQLETEIQETEAEIKTAAINKDDSAERKYKEKRNELKDQRQIKASTFKELENQATENDENRKNKMLQLKLNNEAESKEASKELVEIEASRDAELEALQKDIEKLEDLSSNIIKRIDELAKNREATINEFKELGQRQQKTKSTMVCLPFYLACLQSKSHKRYIYFPPSNLGEFSLTAKLKGIGKTKISQLLGPRFKRTLPILNKFVSLLDENVAFGREVSEACLKTSLIFTDKGQEAIKNGLSKLNSQECLSSTELEDFNEALSRSAQ